MKAAQYLGTKIGISEIYADLLPEEKVKNIASLKQTGKICMIGDGVDDAPALKIGDVTIATAPFYYFNTS